MANNLKNTENTQFKSGSRAVECGRKGGIASGKAKREKKAMKDTLETLLAMTLNNEQMEDIESIQSVASLEGANITVQEAIMLAQIKRALSGDTKAAEYVRDTSGNKLKDSVEFSGAVNNPFSGLTTEELKKLVNDE